MVASTNQVELQEFISTLPGKNWQEIECKITSVDELRTIEPSINKLFENHNNASLAITEIVLNALAITAGLDSNAKTVALQEGNLSQLNLTNDKFVTLKLQRAANTNNIKVIVTDMGSDYFDIEKYLQLTEQTNNKPDINQNGRGLNIVHNIASNLRSYKSDSSKGKGTVVEFQMLAIKPEVAPVIFHKKSSPIVTKSEPKPLIFNTKPWEHTRAVKQPDVKSNPEQNIEKKNKLVIKRLNFIYDQTSN